MTTIEQLAKIAWFSHCGSRCDVSDEGRYISSLADVSEAQTLCFDDTILEARNDVTRPLFDNHVEKYRQWNNITQGKKAELEASVWPGMYVAAERDNIPQVYVGTVTWNILSLLMVEAYADCGPLCPFFHDLLPLYQAGHLPCGWEQGEWPEGRLIVY